MEGVVEEELAEEYWEGGASVLLSIITSNHVFFIKEEDVDSKVSGDFHIYPCFRHWCLR